MLVVLVVVVPADVESASEDVVSRLLRLVYELIAVASFSLVLSLSFSRSENIAARPGRLPRLARYESTSLGFDLSSSKFRDDGLARGWYEDCLVSLS